MGLSKYLSRDIYSRAATQLHSQSMQKHVKIHILYRDILYVATCFISNEENYYLVPAQSFPTANPAELSGMQAARMNGSRCYF